MDEINGLGGKMLARLSESKDVNEFLEMSFQFAQTLGLTEGKCRIPLEALRAAGIPASVALFGQTVFTLVPEERSGEAAGALKGFGGTVLVCNIGTGARVLENK
jgi:pantoate kinase